MLVFIELAVVNLSNSIYFNVKGVDILSMEDQWTS